MAFVHFKFSLFFVALLFCTLQLADAQGTCSCAGGDISGPDESLVANSCPAVQDNCDEEFQCSISTCVDQVTDSTGLTTFSCPTVASSACMRITGSGRGDPHLTGFDGSKFEFHGAHGKNYALFGRSSGDMLVAGIKASEHMHAASGVNATFFNEFGLQVAGSQDRVRVYLAKNTLKEGHWLPKVEVNGKEIKESLYLTSSHIAFRSGEKWVSIATRESNFVITTGRPENEHLSHLNVRVSLKGPPSASEKYLGVLGVTLNRALGHDVHPNLDVTGRARTLEMAMRNHFEVESLFPRPNDEHDMSLSGVARTISGIERVDKIWRAAAYSMLSAN